MIILPVRTESVIQRTPVANYLLLGLNLVMFLVLYEPLTGKRTAAFKDEYLAFHSDQPAVHEFFTYQFLHADLGHLIGNLICLWVFGNSVNGKLGHIPYLLFYLAGGVFAAWGYALVHPAFFQLIGASGSIAAVTTAYLAWFPRSHVTVLVWFFVFLHFYELPATILIGLKIVVWDNLLAPRFGGPSQVAYGAHLAGYLFGFLGGLILLWLRAVPRDQFDILALWRRWYQRREFASAMADPSQAAKARYGAVARLDAPDERLRILEEEKRDRIQDRRVRLEEALESKDFTAATKWHAELTALDERQCMPERRQLEMARVLYAAGLHERAAAAFARFAECYPNSNESAQVNLLLGIIYARDLREYEAADRTLTECMTSLRDAARRAQCVQWLSQVRAALGRPAPEV
jgi:membrane associated rhomboid family serine protease